ncbi:multiple sugar transport system substrate-binding protein [Paenibacillus sp. UNCCL117]|uniref:ABC transporter substrate-binding protein n=1 Tax=unclassified Paenibacillus TaxID=185978 RepID=UPI00088521C7|nr:MULTISPECIES: extracellular solute-binding protein [unclassified Paenibacillus]SDC15959.1 multiple sugar transport system substrate-binding protein [Paenibacillus sp. cl123]SFW17659.1 multiple sugar transport system substrate-binding protein [Paenibacillus sp. UNCCL117]
MVGWKQAGAAALLCCTMLTGCQLGTPGGDKSGETLKKLDKDEKASIKVMYYDKSSFFQQYGNLFMAKYPNIEVQVVSLSSLYSDGGQDPRKAFQKLLDEEQPDVLLYSNPDEFQTAAEEGKLLELDSVIQQDKFDIDNLLASVTATIRAKGGGKLYGLSPTFYSQALFYNRDLFEKHGVPLPTNKMTWEEVLQLAKRFPTGGADNERVYGLGMTNSGPAATYYFVNNIAATNGMSFVDVDKQQVTVQTDGWKKVLEMTVDAYRSKSIMTEDPMKFDPNQPMTISDFALRNPFVAGKAAMMIGSTYTLTELERAKESVKNVTPVNWDLVTAPVDPQNREVTNSISVSNLFAVNAQSPNKRAAWEFIKYISGEEMARLMANIDQGAMSSRTAFVKERDGRSLEPFYMLKMNENSLYKDMEKLPQNFYMQFSQLAGTEIQAAIDGKKTVDEALKTVQEQGQLALTRSIQEQEEKDKNEAGKAK